MVNPWDEIFKGAFDKAFEIANENYSKSADDIYLRSRAISSLLLRNYKSALDDFLLLNEIEKNSSQTSDGTYMYIGLCYYALGDIENAVTYFKYPLTNKKEIKYTSDISVPPSVLLFIGCKLNRQDITKIAIKELKRLSKFKTPASIYLLGMLSERELNFVFEIQHNETMRNRKQCKVAFYKAVYNLQNGYFERFKSNIMQCVELTGMYLEFEYYIAKVEHDVYLQLLPQV